MEEVGRLQREQEQREALREGQDTTPRRKEGVQMRKRRVGEEIQSPVAPALSPAGTPAPTPPPGEQLSEPDDGDEEEIEAAARRWRLQAILDLPMDQALDQALEATLWT